MMTDQNAQATARQTLGNALRFFREQRKLSQRDLANRVGCSDMDIDDWERGKAAPPDHRWGRLCKMLHDDLAGMRATWQRARAEEERERAEKAPPTGRLTTKPFANLKLVPPAPEPAPEPKPVPVVAPAAPIVPPDTLHDDGFDLRPAYKAVAKLPDGWRSTEAIAARKQYAVELIKQGLTSDDIYKEVKRKFGVGIGAPALTELRAEIREAKAREHRAATGRPEPVAAEAEVSAPPPPPPPAPKPAPPPPAPEPATPANDIEGAVRLILEAIPNLKSFKIDVADNGDVSVDHTIREVKVIETSGTLKLKR